MPTLTACRHITNITKLNRTNPLLHISVCKYVTSQKTSSAIKQGLPNTISQREAVEKFTSWADQLWFAPKEWKHQLGSKVVLHYLPHWYFSGVGTLSYVGKLGFNRTYQVVVNKRVEYRTTIDWTAIPNRYIYNYEFAHQIYASYELERAHVNQLVPWDIAQLGPLHSSTDSVIDTYTIDYTTAYTLAWNEGINKAAETVCLNDLRRSGFTADHYEIKTFSLHESDLKYTMIYLPAYILQYAYLGEDFHILMNARSGKIKGYRQYDGDAISLALLGVSSAVYCAATIFTGGTFSILGAIAFVLVPPLLAGMAIRLQPQFMKRYYRPFMKDRGSKYFTQQKAFPDTGREQDYEKIHQEQRRRDYGRTRTNEQSGSSQQQSGSQRQYGGQRQSGSQQAPRKDLYALLGVSKNATQAEIKKGYRLKALETHPDHHPEDREAAEKKFKEINEAYQVLSDGNSRAEYDRSGSFR